MRAGREHEGKRTPLLSELLNCLSAYTATFDGILACISNACDSTPRSHDSPIIIQVQDLLSIDALLKEKLQQKEECEARQREIKRLEDQLAALNARIHGFTEALSSSKRNLEYCIKATAKMQKDVMQNSHDESEL